jgi:hypothetical protein
MVRHESSPSASSREAARARLFAAPFGEFTEVRKALVKELRAEGARAVADEVAKEKRPTRAAWALNQVARSKPEEVESFVDAAKRGREAQSRAIGHSDAGALREVGRAMNESASRILKLASEVIAKDGGQVSTALARTINGTLRATPFASKEDIERLRHGTLVGDLEPPGDFEVLGSVSGAASAPVARKEPRKEATKTSAEDAKEKTRAIATAEREKREQARRAAAEAEGQRRLVAKLERAAKDADGEAARLERAATAAEAHARAAKKEAEAARSKATEARSELARAKNAKTTARTDE